MAGDKYLKLNTTSGTPQNRQRFNRRLASAMQETFRHSIQLVGFLTR